MSYQPNFNDPRVIRRVEDALLFATGIAEVDEHTYISQSAIHNNIGHESSNLAKYLKELLLICTDEHYSKDGGFTKQYILNWDGVIYLIRQLSHQISTEIVYLKCSPDLIQAPLCNTQLQSSQEPLNEMDLDTFVALADKRYCDELEQGNLTYEEKGNRDNHPIQRLPGRVRSKLFVKHKYHYDYDIDCAAPTIISQYAKMNGLLTATPTIDYYITNKNEVRERIADLLTISIKDAKELINALFNKARLQISNDYTTCAISKLLHNSNKKIMLAKQDEFIAVLREEIDECWKHLIKSGLVPRRNKGPDDQHRRSGKDYSAVYRTQETMIEREVKLYITNLPTNKCVMIHDGWVCVKELDEQSLIDHIKSKTGYQLRLTMDMLT
jgi:hypothetical protein